MNSKINDNTTSIIKNNDNTTVNNSVASNGLGNNSVACNGLGNNSVLNNSVLNNGIAGKINDNTNGNKIDDDSNFWSDEHEDVLNILYKATNMYYKRFHIAYSRYKQKLHYYRIPIIVMSSLSGFASILNVGYVPIAYNKWVSLSVGFIYFSY